MEFIKRIGESMTTSAVEDPRDLIPALGSVHVVIEVLAGRNLVAKDRNWKNQKTTSDVFANVYHRMNGDKQHIGSTEVQYKTLDPAWNQKLDLIVDGDDANLRKGVDLVFEIYDRDDLSSDDFMGAVELHVDLLQSVTEDWYDVQTTTADNLECKNATGKLHLVASVTGRNVPALQAGNVSANKPLTRINMAWNLSNAAQVGCVVLGPSGELQTIISQSSTGSDTDGVVRMIHHDGNGCSFALSLPNTSLSHYYFCLMLSKSTEDAPGLRVRFFQDGPGAAYELRPRQDRQSTILCRISSAFAIEMIDYGVDLVGYGFVGTIPYLRDLSERQHEGDEVVIDVHQYVPIDEPTIYFAALWELINPDQDMDLAAVCLDEELELTEIISFRQLISQDKSIKHYGDAREDKEGMDELLRLKLGEVSPQTKHIGITLNSHSGSTMDICKSLQYRVYAEFDGIHDQEAMIQHSVLDSLTQSGLVWVVLSRTDDGIWTFTAANRSSPGTTAKETVETMRTFLTEGLETSLCLPASQVDASMPAPIPIMEVEEDVMIPAFEFQRYLFEQSHVLE